jgi:hypothetical protein
MDIGYQRVPGMSIVGLTSGAIRTSSTRDPTQGGYTLYQWLFAKSLGTDPQEGTITSAELLLNDTGSNNISFIVGELITVYTRPENTHNHNGTYYLHNYRIVDPLGGHQLGEITVSCLTGDVTPTPTPTATHTPTPTVSLTPTNTVTPTVTITPTITITPSPTRNGLTFIPLCNPGTMPISFGTEDFCSDNSNVYSMQLPINNYIYPNTLRQPPPNAYSGIICD